jgi:hypothetical protein
LQASFQSPDFLAKILRLHNEDQYCFRRSRTRLALDIELLTKPPNVTSLFFSGVRLGPLLQQKCNGCKKCIEDRGPDCECST